MRLILARHGNTFGPADAVRWIGARTDPPLVAKGREQAEAIGRALARINVHPARILCAPLSRTRETALLAATAGGLSHELIEIEPRLIEIDHGAWEGLTSEQIRATRGSNEIDAWERDGLWPEDAGWSPTEAELRLRSENMLASLRERFGDDATLVLVSSGGVLRCFGEICGIDRKSAKMRTGALSMMETKDAGWRATMWNAAPHCHLD